MQPSHQHTFLGFCKQPSVFEFTVMTNEGTIHSCNERVIYHSEMLRQTMGVDADWKEKGVVYLPEVDGFSYRLIFTWCHDHQWRYYDSSSKPAASWPEGWFVSLSNVKLSTLLEAVKSMEIHGLIYILEQMKKERIAPKPSPRRVCGPKN